MVLVISLCMGGDGGGGDGGYGGDVVFFNFIKLISVFVF